MASNPLPLAAALKVAIQSINHDLQRIAAEALEPDNPLRAKATSHAAQLRDARARLLLEYEKAKS